MVFRTALVLAISMTLLKSSEARIFSGGSSGLFSYWPLSTIGGPAEPNSVYGPPAPVYGLPAQPPVVKKNEEPLFNSADILALWDALRKRAIDSNPIVRLYRRFRSNNVEDDKYPTYKFVPALGFTHYNNIKYYPIVEVKEPAYPPAIKTVESGSSSGSGSGSTSGFSTGSGASSGSSGLSSSEFSAGPYPPPGQYGLPAKA